jgi:hypothetical protein
MRSEHFENEPMQQEHQGTTDVEAGAFSERLRETYYEI